MDGPREVRLHDVDRGLDTPPVRDLEEVQAVDTAARGQP